MGQYDGTTATYPMGNGYTCASCGAWVGYGTFHSCAGTGTTATYPAFTWTPTPCDHCLCIKVPRSKLKSGSSPPNYRRTKTHMECCHCGKFYVPSS